MNNSTTSIKSMVAKIISGGQTGSDKGGLLAGFALGIPTGGTAPKGWRTENGKDLTLESFGLQQSTLADYDVRTRRNIENSHMTIIFSSETNSPGTKLTIKFCGKLGKKYVMIHPDNDLASEMVKTAIKLAFEANNNSSVIVNVAGNRESKSPGIEQKVQTILTKSLI